MSLPTLAAQLRTVASPHPTHPCASAPLRELTVADGASADIGELTASLRTPLMLLSPAGWALERLSAAIEGCRLDVLHIVAHGRAGAICLGGQWIDTRALAAASGLLAKWEVASIALWSCHGGADQTLAQVLGALTGAKVLVADGALGMVEGEARWTLRDADGGALPARFAAPFADSVMHSWPHQLAKLTFVNAYAVNTATTPAAKEANSVNISTTPLHVTRIDDRSGGVNFSGNDVVVEALIDGVTYYGWVSRPIKSGGVVRGYYFWTDPQLTSLAAATADGNADGDGNALDNRGFVLVVDQAWFDAQATVAGSGGALKNVGTSSDRVDSGLNALLAVNSAPAPQNDAASSMEDGGTHSGNVLTNDGDANSDGLTVTGFSIGGVAGTLGLIQSIAGVGSFTLQATGAYTFTPNLNYAGPVPAVTYTVSDGRGGSASATLSISVARVNDAPSGTDKTISAPENTAYTFSAADFGFSDGADSPANSLASVVIVSLPGQGALTLNGVALVAGAEVALADLTKLAFTPAADGAGTGYASFGFKVRDNGGTANGGVDLDASTNVITFNVSNINSAPQAVADNGSTGNVLANDTDIDAGDTFTVISAAGAGNAAPVAKNTVVAGSYGSLSVSADGSYSYTADSTNAAVKAMNGTATLTDTFTYTMADSGGLTSSASLTVTVSGVNDAIDAVDDFNFAVSSSVPSVRVNASGNVLTNDRDADSGDAMTVTRGSSGATLGGTVVTLGATSGGSGSSASGAESRVYTAFTTKGSGNIKTGNSVTGDGVPTGTTVKIETSSSGLRTIEFSNGVGLDFATTVTIDGNAYTIQDRLTPSSTMVALTGVTGTVSNNMQVTGTGIQNGTTVSTVTTSGALTLVTLSQAISGTLGTDVQFGTVYTPNTIAGAYGNLTLQADGSYVYTYTDATPRAATETFTYEVRDTAGLLSTAQLTVDVVASSVAAPVAAADSGNTVEDGAAATGNVLTNDKQSTGIKEVSHAWTTTAPIMTPVSASGATLVGEYGTLTIAANGTYSYAADNADDNVNALALGESLSETFNYRIGSSSDGFASAALTVTIAGANDAPTAVADTASAREAGGVQNASAGHDASGNLLRNDLDPDNGAVLTVTHAGKSSASGTVSAGTTASSGATIAGTYGSLRLGADGSYTYVVNESNAAVQALNSGANLTDSFVYLASDGTASSTSSLTVTVAGANDAPVLTTGTGPTIMEGASGIVAGISVADVDDTSLTVALGVANGLLSIGTLGAATIAAGANGSAALTLSGSAAAINAALASLSYQGAPDYAGIDSLRITAVDGGALVDVAGIDVTVTPDNRALTVTASTVNEASGYAVFSVAGAVGQKMTLELAETGQALANADYAASMEYYDGAAWQAYAGHAVPVPAGGALLVRVAILNDMAFEGAESFRLNATNRAGVSYGGNAIITDDGTGATFSGAVSGGVPAAGVAQLDDDRALTVTSSTVNERSGYAMFTVDGANGQQVTLSLANGNASNADHGTTIEYYDGAAWQTSTGTITLGTSGSLQLRVAITDDNVYEGAEVFGLIATNGSGRSFVGTATIVDDGTGLRYTGAAGATGLATNLDNDLAVNVVAHGPVNEGSDYAMFTVSATPGEMLELALSGSGTAPAGAGGFALQFSVDGSTWTTYDSATEPLVPSGGKVFVRADIRSEQDALVEGAETFTLTASIGSGAGASHGAVATIVDDGSGSRFPGTLTAGTPDAATTGLDHDVLPDTTAPTIAITSDRASLSSGQSAALTFTLSEGAGNFDASDIAVSGGSLSNFKALSATHYTATFTPAASSTASATIHVASGAFSDAAGNNNIDGKDVDNTVTLAVNTVTVTPPVGADTTAPTIAITSDRASVSSGQSATLTFTLSEGVTNFGASDVTVSGGTLSNFTSVSSSLYTATFTPAPSSTASATIHVASGVFTDAAGNANADGSDADNTLSLAVNTVMPPVIIIPPVITPPAILDTTAPKVAITADRAALAAGQNAVVTFTLSEASSTFGAGDITVTGGTLSNVTALSATQYSATFTPLANSTVTAVIKVASGVFADSAGNLNADGAEADNTLSLAVNTVVAPVIVPVTPPAPVGLPAPSVTITEDSDNNGTISRTELDGLVDVRIGLPAGAQAGDTVVVSNGATEQRIVLSAASIAAGGVGASFAAPAPGTAIAVIASIVNAAGTAGASGNDSAVRGSGVALAVTAVTPDTGVQGDFITSAKALVFNGTAETGTIVNVKVNGKLVGSVLAVNDRWSFDNTSMQLPKGDNELTVVNGNNPKDSATVMLRVFSAELNPAADDGASNTDRTTSITNPDFILKAENIMVAGDVARLVGAGGKVAGSVGIDAAAAAAGLVDVPTDQLDDGLHTFMAQILDAAGTVKAEQAVSVTIVTDRDGVMPSVELAAHGGDFNRDGIVDWKQNNVAHLPMSSVEAFAAGKAAPAASFGAIMAGGVGSAGSGAVQLDGNAQLLDVGVSAAPAPLPANMIGVTPMLAFSVTSAAGGALTDLDAGRAGLQTRIVVDLPTGVNANTFLKFDRATGTWFSYDDDGRLDTFDDGATLLDLNGDGRIDRMVITLTDGGRGDEDGVANGIIVDPGMLAMSAAPVYSVLLENGDRRYTTSAAEAAEAAKGIGNVFEGVRFDSLAPGAGGQHLAAKYQPFTDDWWFGAASQEDPYLCYELMLTSSGFFAAAAGSSNFGKIGQTFHLYQDWGGQTQLVTQAEAASMGLRAKGFVDAGAQFSTTTAGAFRFDPEAYLIANKDRAETQAFVQTLAAKFKHSGDAGFVDAVEQHYLGQVTLTGVAHGDAATAAELNAVFGTLFL